MRVTLKGWTAALLLLLAIGVVSCNKPPASAYVSASTSASGTPIGKNTTGDDCTLVDRGGNGADIFCGAWGQPSARIRSGGPAGSANLTALATSSPWRAELESHFTCGDPRSESSGTIVLQCNRRSGGWPQIAMITTAGGTVWLTDGVPAAFPVIQRGVAKLAGGNVDVAAASNTQLSADMASYLAARAYSAGDIAQYEGLMTAGLQANLSGRPDEAEKAYRAALALQIKQNGGKDTPASAAALMSIALQLSDQDHFEDAKAFFNRADNALKGDNASQLDANGPARLALYRALDDLNQARPKDAEPLLLRAEAMFKAQAPDARETPVARPKRMFGTSGLSLSSVSSSSTPFMTLVEKEALLGMLEARRNLAIAQRLAGEYDQAARTAQSAEVFARANGLTSSLYTARLHRTAGIADEANHETQQGLDELAESVTAFKASQPRTRPTAEAELIDAAALDRQGNNSSALTECRSAIELLVDTKDGVDFQRMAPCLDVYEKLAESSSGDSKQILLKEMFTASQLTRGTVTDQEIRRTAVRLAAKDPKVSDAIRRQQDAERDLTDLLRARDTLNQQPQDAGVQAKAADLDKKITDARAKLADADQTVQSAAPNYQQLIQQAVKPEDVFNVLKPDEAFVAITLADKQGWTFVMRDKTITVGHIDAGSADIAKMVKTLRASIEPGDDNKVPDFAPGAALKLYQTVLGKVAPALDGAKSVTFAPTGPLLSVPFETLLTGPADDKDLSHAPFLIRKYVITHVPAAANFVKLRSTGPSVASQPWFGFGNFNRITPDQAARTYPGARCKESADVLAALPSLEGTQQELALASRIFNAPATDVREGAAFTVAGVESLTLKDYKIVHFAAHALLPSELACQDEPAIVTSTPPGATDAKQALLTASDIAGLKLDADAVILSACNSGGPGGTSAGESLAGLARSFFYAGARSLLVTHWEVDDSAADIIVSKALLSLSQKKGEGLSAALRQSQLSWLDRSDIQPALKHPFYWAPFAIVGNSGGYTVTAESAAPLHQASRL
jgi:CHAT domain-containing protein